MRLWSIQPKEYLNILEKDRVLHCDPSKSTCLTDLDFVAAYNWLSQQMIKRIGTPPNDVKYPIWAWHTIDWKRSKPDLRLTEFRKQSQPAVCFELEVPDYEVLLSDELSWHIVLNDGYYNDALNEVDFDKQEAWFASFSKEQQINIKEKSWERIFKVSPPTNDGWSNIGQYIQATFWDLKIEYVVDVRHLNKK